MVDDGRGCQASRGGHAEVRPAYRWAPVSSTWLPSFQSSIGTIAAANIRSFIHVEFGAERSRHETRRSLCNAHMELTLFLPSLRTTRAMICRVVDVIDRGDGLRVGLNLERSHGS